MGALFLIERESVGKNEGCALLAEGTQKQPSCLNRLQAAEASRGHLKKTHAVTVS